MVFIDRQKEIVWDACVLTRQLVSHNASLREEVTVCNCDKAPKLRARRSTQSLTPVQFISSLSREFLSSSESKLAAGTSSIHKCFLQSDFKTSEILNFFNSSSVCTRCSSCALVKSASFIKYAIIFNKANIANDQIWDNTPKRGSKLRGGTHLTRVRGVRLPWRFQFV